MLHFGQAAVFEPGSGRNRVKQARQRTSPSLGPAMIFLVFIEPPLMVHFNEQ
jgi:hypothetical protein